MEAVSDSQPQVLPVDHAALEDVELQSVLC